MDGNVHNREGLHFSALYHKIPTCQMLTMREELEAVRLRLQSGKLRIHLPHSSELFRNKRQGHFHATPELFFQTGGATDFDCAGEVFRQRAQEVCVIPSGMPHAETPIDTRTPYGVIVCMQARDGFFFHRAFATVDRRIVGGATDHHASVRGRGAFQFLDEMPASFSMPEKFRRTYVENLLEVFLLNLLTEMRRSPEPQANSARSPLVAEAERRALASIADPEMSVNRLARDLNCSADYLSRRFHEERGQVFTAWLNRERIAMARDFLGDSRFNIAEIGWACGFSTPSYFIRVFQKHTGLTPRAYRLAQTVRG